MSSTSHSVGASLTPIDIYLDIIDPYMKPFVEEFQFSSSNVLNVLPNQCYSWSRYRINQLCGREQACYCEGVVLMKRYGMIPVPHAWVVNEAGHLEDGTDVDHQYPRIGYRIPEALFNSCMKNSSFVEQFERYKEFPFLRAYHHVYQQQSILSDHLARHKLINKQGEFDSNKQPFDLVH